MLFILLPWTLSFFPISDAFLWSRSDRNIDEQPQSLLAGIAISFPLLGTEAYGHVELPLTPNEIGSIFRTQGGALLFFTGIYLTLVPDSLQEYSRRSDCFRRVAGSIKVRCSALEMDEDERVSAAISMTLCELATAKHLSPPLECAPFSSENTPLYSQKHDDTQGKCVEALSRSAQFWSSYSGYLREVPQLCFSFRRWHDIDTARDIYSNITQEKIALLRYLSQRQHAEQAHMSAWESHLSVLPFLVFLSPAHPCDRVCRISRL
ncbi:hypothetical protein ARMSODRAFT_884180 [Armillaria solidipes]|uniref:Uncharacterized protein n=1 Tax=Armillaria solidipes TaxID=1076256 RepID=A0A2H3C286_9AGAR|nr:hypothetical protein ARMSODRAFT_884180 [Armillaria solidipes]